MVQRMVARLHYLKVEMTAEKTAKKKVASWVD
jgi:hypothetical protein